MQSRPMKALHRYALVLAVSLAILVFRISTAPMMFDESAYVSAARNFNAGTPSSNPEHPPLAKYLIALSIRTLGDAPLGWRFPSALAGAFLALSLFGLTFRLTRSWHSSFVAWLLVVANVFWYVMSRIAMLSIFELAFEAAAVWTFMVAIEEKGKEKTLWFGLTGALFGLSIGCRWVGAIGFLVSIAYALVYYRPFLKAASVMMATTIAAYAASWVPLIVREHRTAHYLLTANTFILEFQRHAKGEPRLGQMWWSWIFRLQPQPSLSYLVGNPVIGILGLAALVLLLWQRKPLLPALYFAHVMQWAIAIRPVTYYYYYLEPISWLSVALAVAMQDITIRRARLDVVVTGCALVAFVFWYMNFVLPG
jgi:dolichyl-phosphate-mannose--protein O-mannosyl transferase